MSLDRDALTLRGAITIANSQVGPDTIQFEIGSGSQTIALKSPLPAIIGELTIDGSSQEGWAGKPLIVLTDASASQSIPYGLQIGAPSVIDSLVIQGFQQGGIRLDSHNNVVRRSFIGTGSDGNTSAANGGPGILINNSSGNLIGGPSAGAGNVISGNAGEGIWIVGTSASDNQILGNLIGLSFEGDTAVPNGSHGILVQGARNTEIGGPNHSGRNIISGNRGDGVRITGDSAVNNVVQSNLIGLNRAGTMAVGNLGHGVAIVNADLNRLGGPRSAGNVISGNLGRGIDLSGSADRNLIQGNQIGTDAFGQSSVPNQRAGIYLTDATRTKVGGTEVGAGNVIAFNGTTVAEGGVVVVGANATGNTILRNSIHANSGPGIDLGGDGHNENDPGDLDLGPNRRLNYPDLKRAITGFGSTQIHGTFHGRPNQTLMLEFFTSPTLDTDDEAEGRVVLDDPGLNRTIRTDADGNADFAFLLPTGAAIGHYVTATATDEDGNTSEFSQAIRLETTQATDLVLDLTDSPNPATVHEALAYRLKVTNRGNVTAGSVRIVDRLPAEIDTRNVRLDWVEGQNEDEDTLAYDAASNQVLAKIDRLAPGESVELTITVIPTRVGTLTNLADVLSLDTLDRQASDNVRSTETRVTQPADLVVSFLPQPDTMTAGSTFTHVIVVTNQGPESAHEAILAATISPGTAIVRASSDEGDEGMLAGNTVTFQLGTVPSGESRTFRIEVQPGIEQTNTSIDAVASASQSDPNPANNQASRVVAILPAADVELVLLGASASTVTGGSLRYALQVATNIGPYTAPNVTLIATLPAGVVFESATISPARIEENRIIFSLGDLEVNQDGPRLEILARVEAQGTTPLLFTAELRSDLADPRPENNTVRDVTTLNPADLALTFGAPSAVDLLVPFAYTARVQNEGPATAGSARFLMNLPDGLDFHAADSTPGLVFEATTRQITYNLTDLAPDHSLDLVISVTPRDKAFLFASAGVALLDQVDPSFANNIRVMSSAVSPADLGVTLVGFPMEPVLVGDAVSWTVRATNHGPWRVKYGTMTQVLPTGVQIESADPITGVRSIEKDGDRIIAHLDDLSPGATAEFVVTLRPKVEGTFATLALVSSEQIDALAANNTASANLVVENRPGVMRFAEPVVTVNEVGEARITVERHGGTLGAVAVFYEVIGGTAIPGLHYGPNGGVLIFKDGERTKSFNVPIGRDGLVSGDRTIEMRLVDIGYGQIDEPATATIIVKENDYDVTAPWVSDIRLVGGTSSIRSIDVVFSEPMDPVQVQDPERYSVTAGISTGLSASPVRVAEVRYDPSERTASLTLTNPLPLGVFHTLNLDGESVRALRDIAGNRLDGDRDGVMGGNFVVTAARGRSLTYNDDNGDLVNLRVAGGGFVEVVRALGGSALWTRVTDAIPGRSMLTGSVKRSSPGGDGVTSLGSISGIGSFGGGALSRLTQPPFFVTNGALPAPTTALTFFRARSKPSAARAVSAWV